MNWKQSLDRYLTTPPDDGFDGFFDQVIELLPSGFYEEYEGWLYGDECNTILYSYFRHGYTPEQAANDIQIDANIQNP